MTAQVIRLYPNQEQEDSSKINPSSFSEDKDETRHEMIIGQLVLRVGRNTIEEARDSISFTLSPTQSDYQSELSQFIGELSQSLKGGFETTGDPPKPNTEGEKAVQCEKFCRELLLSLEHELVERGFNHPAEGLIEEGLRKFGAECSTWVKSLYLKNLVEEPELAAGILFCVGRLPRERVGPWGLEMASAGLADHDIEVRESAVRALERWGGNLALEALKNHVDSEEVSWLKTSITKIIEHISRRVTHIPHPFGTS